MIPEQCLGHIKSLLETQRFIFSVFVTNEELMQQFTQHLKNIEEFLKIKEISQEDQTDDEIFKDICESNNLATAPTMSGDDNTLVPKVDVTENITVDVKPFLNADQSQTDEDDTANEKLFLEEIDIFKCMNKCSVDGCENETRFKNEKSLGNHIRINHQQDRIFICNVCDIRFPTKRNLLEHKRKLLFNPRRFQCDQGEYVGTTLPSLNLHLTTHSSERNFSCQHCGSLFKSIPRRRAHELIHTGQRNYKCDQCGKAFITSSKLVRHKKVHTGEFDYSCSSCEKKFNQKNNLKTHVLKHHAEKS